MVFFEGPTDRVEDSLNFFVRPLSKLCISVREMHAYLNQLFESG